MTLPIKNAYGRKDRAKAEISTCFIGEGCPNSSTHLYHKYFLEHGICNKDEYVRTDVVFTSTNGNRKYRVKPLFSLIKMAIRAKASIVTDTKYHRTRTYNIGEREVAQLLVESNYIEEDRGLFSVWTFNKRK